MWTLQQLSGVVVGRRGFLRPVSIATHSSSWVLLPTYPLHHTTNLSSSPWPIASPAHCWNGHWVNPLGLLLSLQPLGEIKPTWVCFLSARLPIGLSAPPLCLSLPPHDRAFCYIPRSIFYIVCHEMTAVLIVFVVFLFSLCGSRVGCI